MNNRLAIIGSIALATSIGACSSSVKQLPPSPIAKASVPAETKFLVNVNAEGVAIDGYDPVGFFKQGRPVKGDAKYQAISRGAIYWFASAENKAEFERNPAKYTPQFGGYCAYAASIDKVSPINVQYWEIVDGRLLLQHNAKAWGLWHEDPARNLVRADANWPGLVNRHGL